MDSNWVPLPSLQTPALQNNITYLRTFNHELLRFFEGPSNLSSTESLCLQKQNGGIRCRTQSEPPVWLIGETDAGAEVSALHERLGPKIGASGLLVLIGGAIGYGVAAVIPAILQNPQLRVIVVEPTCERIRAAFSLVEMHNAIATERLHFIVSEISIPRILEQIETLNPWDAETADVFVSPELEGRIDGDEFLKQYKERSAKTKEKYERVLAGFASNERNSEDIERVLIVNCWAGAPGGLHLQSIEGWLKKRNIQTRWIQLNRYRIDRAPLDYRKLVERQFLQCFQTYKPDLVIGFGYHAPQFVSETLFESTNADWVQMVTNVAYYDETQYPGEHAFVIDPGMVPHFERRGYSSVDFIPLMADYVADRPTPTDRRFPIVFVGNSLGLPPASVQEFFRKWEGRNELIDYICEAENVLGDFNRQSNLYDYLDAHPIPQISTERERYEIFRYLLCQGSASRRRAILEWLAPFGLLLFGGDWNAYLPPDSSLRQCLKGALAMQEEPKAFAHGSVFVNVQSVGHATGPNMRYFNVAGMGAFQIGDCPQFDRYLQSDAEMVYCSSLDEYVDRVRYYLDRPSEMDAIRAAAQKKVNEKWTYNNWLDAVFEKIRNRPERVSI